MKGLAGKKDRTARLVALVTILFTASLPAAIWVYAQHPVVPNSGINTVTNGTNPQLAIRDWDAPSPNSMPEDIFFNDHDGIAWFSAESANVLGRFDSKTQTTTEIHLRPGSDPFCIIAHSGSGVQSTIYFTSYDGGFIGEFDPNTRDVREFRMPGGKLFLHDMAFDRNGVLWFTVLKAKPPQYPQGSEIGSINLFSSEIRIAPTPTTDTSPFGLAVNSKGIPFFTELDSPRLGSISPVTMKITEYTLPNPAIGARNLTITPDDAVWYTDHARGYLGRYEPATGQFAEWPSPGGPHSQPDAITSKGNVIWYSESGSNPNKLVRFDTETHQFQSWPVSNSGTIKYIYVDASGDLWFARPQANGFAKFTPDRAGQ